MRVAKDAAGRIAYVQLMCGIAVTRVPYGYSKCAKPKLKLCMPRDGGEQIFVWQAAVSRDAQCLEYDGEF